MPQTLLSYSQDGPICQRDVEGIFFQDLSPILYILAVKLI